MGRKRRSKGAGGGWKKGKRKKENVWDGDRTKPAGYFESRKHSEAFCRYYKAQKIVPPEEWDTFIKVLKTTLPVTFRINPMCVHFEHLKKELMTSFQFDGKDIEVEGTTVPPVFPLKWMPGHRAWQLSCPRRLLRKSPLLKVLHQWMVKETACGNMTRQELASMIPPVLLDTESHHIVFDMCAAPGSKTSQILEDMHISNRSQGKLGDFPQGMLIANDVDTKRAYLLVHQVKRLRSPLMIATTHNAQHFPSLVKEKGGFFDRILCDVPCTGDGTLRKEPRIWERWDVSGALGLHRLQLQIACRGALQLKEGGLMVYSTCSFNPIENEAVEANLLERCGGALELVDVSGGKLASLKRSPGFHT